MKCVIIGASNISGIIDTMSKFVIASDGGYNYAKKNNIKVDLVVGDLDSIEYEVKEDIVFKYNKEKDETDTFLAIQKGIELGYTDFELYGCIGGRSEHEYANYQILSYLCDRNIKCIMIDGSKKIFMMKENDFYKVYEKNVYVSIFSYTENCNVTIDGLKYNGNNIELNNSFPLGIDNEDLNGLGNIKVNRGKVLVFITNKK